MTDHFPNDKPFHIGHKPDGWRWPVVVELAKAAAVWVGILALGLLLIS